MADEVVPLEGQTGFASHMRLGSRAWATMPTSLLTSLGFGSVSSRKHDLKFAPNLISPSIGMAGWPGTRVVAKVDEASTKTAKRPDVKPMAVKAPSGGLGVFETAGGRPALADLNPAESRWKDLRRWFGRRFEDAAVDQLADVATKAAEVFIVGGAAVAVGTPLVVGGLVAASPTAVRAIHRKVSDAPKPGDRRAWIRVDDPTGLALLVPERTVHPHDGWSRVRTYPDEVGVLAARCDELLDARAAQTIADPWVVDRTLLLAKASLRSLRRNAEIWCEKGWYPTERFQLLMFDDGPPQLADEIWLGVTT